MDYTVEYGTPVSGAEIITRDQAKKNSNIEVAYTDEDSLFDVILSAIPLEIEAYLGYPVLERDNLKITTGWFSSFNLPVKINIIISITYKDDAGNTQTIDADDYEEFAGMLTMNIDKPSGFVKYLTITCTAGFTTANMPGYVKNAALLMFTARETYREDRKEINDTVAKSILRPYRMY